MKRTREKIVKRITIGLDSESQCKLEDMSWAEDRTISSIVLDAIKRYLKRKK